jgi:putative membrane protein (TIGR04086 family)
MKLSWTAIFAGVLGTLFLSYLGQFILSLVASAIGVSAIRPFLSISMYAFAYLIAALGGFFTGRMGGQNGLMHGLILGVLVALVDFLRFSLILQSVNPYVILYRIALIPAAALGGWLSGKVQRTAPEPPLWLDGAVKGMAVFCAVAGFLVLASLKDESGFVYLDGSSVIGFITQAVLILGYLLTSPFRAASASLDEIANLVIIVVLSGLPWAGVGALRATGRRRQATILAIVIVLFSLIPGTLIWVIVQGLSEGPH